MLICRPLTIWTEFSVSTWMSWAYFLESIEQHKLAFLKIGIKGEKSITRQKKIHSFLLRSCNRHVPCNTHLTSSFWGRWPLELGLSFLSPPDNPVKLCNFKGKKIHYLQRFKRPLLCWLHSSKFLPYFSNSKTTELLKKPLPPLEWLSLL